MYTLYFVSQYIVSLLVLHKIVLFQTLVCTYIPLKWRHNENSIVNCINYDLYDIVIMQYTLNIKYPYVVMSYLVEVFRMKYFYKSILWSHLYGCSNVRMSVCVFLSVSITTSISSLC